MDNDDENGYDPRDFVYSQSSDSGSDDEISNFNTKQFKSPMYDEYKASGSNLISRNINNNIADQKELVTKYYNSEDENSMDSFCRKLQQLDVDTSQYTLSFSKLLSSDSSDSTNSDDQHLKTLQNCSQFACIRLSDAYCHDSKPVKYINSSISVENSTPHSTDNHLQFNYDHSECDKTLQHNHTSSNSNVDMKQSTNTSVYQLRHRRTTLPKSLIDPATKQPTESLSSYSHQKKSLKNQIKNALPTRSNPKRSSTITLPSYENLQKVRKLIICKKMNCGKSFASEAELEAHEQTVHPYRCHYRECNSRFDRLDHVKKHMQTHTDILPRECEIPGCGAIYFTRKSYQNHLMKHGRLERMRSRIDVEKTNRSKDVNIQRKNYVRETNTNTEGFIARNEKDKVSVNEKDKASVNEKDKASVNEKDKVNVNERDKVSAKNKRHGVNEDSKGHKINNENKRCRVNADNRSSEVSVDRVVIVITDINK
ncbi:17798_t:CDS:2 [Cetraspora pellucida]|uniref:17798_t:CDS:1 n=1 Tax=Cetraspora pellucida TaxID=1433469 RepID=A0ACA9L3D1_9GLOM|nr:17798_t:CDS:2 [Cetraspora pellucida]